MRGITDPYSCICRHSLHPHLRKICRICVKYHEAPSQKAKAHAAVSPKFRTSPEFGGIFPHVGILRHLPDALTIKSVRLPHDTFAVHFIKRKTVQISDKFYKP